ncbi:MAG: hypothetical protein WCI89_00650 [bacterium]
MQKRFTQLAALLLLLAVFFAPLQGFVPVARAQNADAIPTAAESAVGGAQAIQANNVTQAGAAAAVAGGTATQQQANTALENSPPTGAGGKSSPAGASCLWTDWGLCLSNVVYVFTVGIMGIFAYIGGVVLDYSLQITLNSATYAQSFLTQGWAAVRDIANMAFIFILVYIAITIILKAETSGTLKALASVIVMALLINFSFFFTRVVIDSGNILAVQFYNAIDAPALANAGQTSNAGAYVASATSGLNNGGATKDLTATIMNATGIQTILSPGSFSASFAKNTDWLTNLITFSFIYIIMGALLAILAMVFVGAGVKFIIRSVILWFLIIGAPLAFIAKAFSGTKLTKLPKYFDQWMTMLVEFSFFPAFFLFMFWLINIAANQLGAQCATTGVGTGVAQSCGLLGAAFQQLTQNQAAVSGVGSGSFIVVATAIGTIGIRLGILIAMLYYSMKLSDSFAKQGGSVVHGATAKFGGMMKTVALRAPAAGAAYGARNTVGRAAFSGLNSNWLNNMEKRGLVGRGIGRVATGVFGGVASARMDVRNAPGVKAGLGLLGINAGTPGKGGFDKQVEDRKKALLARGKAVKGNEEDVYWAQRAHEEKFSDSNFGKGKEGFDKKVAALTRDIEREKQVEKDAKAAAAAAKARADAAQDPAAKQAANKEKADADKKAAAAKRDAEVKEREKKDMLEFGKNKIKKEGEERQKALAKSVGEGNLGNLWMPSRGSIRGAEEIRKLFKEKDAKTKLAEAAAAYEKEEHGGDDHPPTPDGTPPHAPTTGGGATPHTPPPVTPTSPATGGDSDHGTGGGHHGAATTTPITAELRAEGNVIYGAQFGQKPTLSAAPIVEIPPAFIPPSAPAPTASNPQNPTADSGKVISAINNLGKSMASAASDGHAVGTSAGTQAIPEAAPPPSTVAIPEAAEPKVVTVHTDSGTVTAAQAANQAAITSLKAAIEGGTGAAQELATQTAEMGQLIRRLIAEIKKKRHGAATAQMGGDSIASRVNSETLAGGGQISQVLNHIRNSPLERTLSSANVNRPLTAELRAEGNVIYGAQFGQKPTLSAAPIVEIPPLIKKDDIAA